MELVEGRTLADRIVDGPLQTAEALTIARQIAEALEAAHEKGIVHRDLKPANIKLTPDRVVKVLDFGLAKADATPADARHPQADVTNSPTFRTGGTKPGVILGTAAYMSPEQSRGEAVDKRTDIWAFGCVLFEMLAGRSVFAAASITETLSEVLKTEPDWQRLPADTPEGVRRLLRRCLTKDRARRLADIRDAQLELDEPLGDTLSASRRESRARPFERLSWATVLLVTVIAAIGTVWRVGVPPPARQVRFEIGLPPTAYPDTLAISPDGGMIVYAAVSDDGRSRLWLHSLNDASNRPLPRTEGGLKAFWSPDSRSVGFFANGSLKRINIGTGTVEPIVDTAGAGAGTWNADGTILIEPIAGNRILRLSDRPGGTAVPVESATGDLPRSPRFLPGGRHLLYSAADAEPRGIYVAELDGAGRKRLVNGTSAVYAPSGYLLFTTQDRSLFAQPFDPATLELSGDRVLIAEQVIAMSVADDGTLVVRSGAAPRSELAWFNESGVEISRLGEGNNPQISADGGRVAFTRVVSGEPGPDIWTMDVAGSTRTKITFGPTPSSNNFPLWSPLDSRIVFASRRNGKPFALYRTSAVSGGPDEELLSHPPRGAVPSDVSHDGRFVIYRRGADPNMPGSVDFDLWVMSLEDKRTSRLVQAGSDFNEREAQFSPDDRWFAYQSDKTGTFQVYIHPFPDGQDGRKEIGPVSTNGGGHVRWRHDGRGLFYFGLDGMLMFVPIPAGTAGNSIVAARPVELFRKNVASAGEGTDRQTYDVSDDGTRFLINTRQDVTAPVTVVLNWSPTEQN